MAYYFRRNVLPTRLITRQVMFLQPQKIALRNSNPVLFQSLLSRSYTKTNVVQSTSRLLYSTKANEDNKENVEKNENTALAYYLIGGITFFISGDNIYSWYVNWCNKRLLKKAIEKGTRPETDVPDDELVLRPEVSERLMKILQPHKNQSFYHMVCGEHGTGKTTLIRMASREVGQVKGKNNKVIQDGGMGVIYVDIPANPNLNKLGDAFEKALNFTFEEHISYTKHLLRKIFGATGETNDPKWERAMDAFKRSAEVYKAKHKKPPVIVYDNVSRLVHKNPEILDILQDDAKDNADDRMYLSVVKDRYLEEWNYYLQVIILILARSAWSRADKPVIEIGDLSEKESKDYLIKRCTIKEEKEGKIIKMECKIKDEEVEKLYKLVGGRIVDLKSVADKFLAGQSLEVIKQSILDEVEKKFNAARLLPNDPHYEVGKSIFSDLKESNELSFLAFKKYFDKIDELNEVLGSNVFAYHPAKNTVTFQSQSIKCYILEKGDMFLKKSK
ncbi:P-loop containing nucleoside triphosphate hydrolase protein [Glomus cerebriforme]|uniref:P-loop containing nucleoside triphosphate hydrolase protein n=1 Tax=Glomus cerebriforme TaxID=658196 RepID=A0A397S8T6_9GLOM|nr:P-loop containing nucleoside triphosphate hydrolase protein [Glomus cerebriforme]